MILFPFSIFACALKGAWSRVAGLGGARPPTPFWGPRSGLGRTVRGFSLGIHSSGRFGGHAWMPAKPAVRNAGAGRALPSPEEPPEADGHTRPPVASRCLGVRVRFPLVFALLVVSAFGQSTYQSATGTGTYSSTATSLGGSETETMVCIVSAALNGDGTWTVHVTGSVSPASGGVDSQVRLSTNPSTVTQSSLESHWEPLAYPIRNSAFTYSMNFSAGASNAYFSMKTYRSLSAPGSRQMYGVVIPKPAPLDEQTVTVSPSSGNIEWTGGGGAQVHNLTGTASGAQGGNLYNIELVSGSVSPSINTSTGAWVLTPSGLGAYVVRVWASAGNGYAQSNYAQITGAVVDDYKYKATVTLDNSMRDIATTFQLRQGGVDLAMYIVPAGLKMDVTVEAADDGPIQVVIISGLTKSPHGIWNHSDTPADVVVATVDPTEVPDAVTPPPAQSVTPPEPAQTQQKESTKNVWNNVTGTNAADALDKVAYAEGVDKITGVLRDISATVAKIEKKNFGGVVGGGDGEGDEVAELLKSDVVGPAAGDYDGDAPTFSGGTWIDDILPEIPAIEMAPPVSSISVTFKLPIGSDEQTFELGFDAAPYESQISVFRMIFTAASIVGFFILYISTIRKAFAT